MKEEFTKLDKALNDFLDSIEKALYLDIIVKWISKKLTK